MTKKNSTPEEFVSPLILPNTFQTTWFLSLGHMLHEENTEMRENTCLHFEHYVSPLLGKTGMGKRASEKQYEKRICTCQLYALQLQKFIVDIKS